MPTAKVAHPTYFKRRRYLFWLSLPFSFYLVSSLWLLVYVIIKIMTTRESGTSRILRSMITPEQKHLEEERKKQEVEAKLNRPFLKYDGKVTYNTTFNDCAYTCDNLLNWLNQSEHQECVVGFDMEWPFSFKMGAGKTALLQISPDLERCHLLHLSSMTKLPKALVELLHHPKLRLTGVNIKNDIRKLCRDFKEFDANKLLPNCIDLGVLASTILPVTGRWSMEKLVDYILKMRIDKNKKIRMSKWHIVPLSCHQQNYAAIDGYASLLLYQELIKLKSSDENINILNIS
ncbi:3'-5' exonuclease [Cylas formicarius]|uniref:3'-5' exonuclease n=1 Tax=Cylas formicarius TaxID=197179 RepID=UPI002958489F|nr:3'-5' exonuclease [Cylas formicarius]